MRVPGKYWAIIHCITGLLGTVPPLCQAQESDAGASVGRLAISLLHERCFSCHNEEDRKGDLVLTSRAAIEAANQEFDLLVPGQPESSALVSVLAPDADPHMPPKEQLSSVEIELLSQWVRDGAEWNENDLIAATSLPTLPSRGNMAPLPEGIKPVLAIALSPNESRLAAGLGSRVKVIEEPQSSEYHASILTGHRGLVRSLAWSPLAPYHLVSGGYRRLVYWDTEAHEPIRIVEDHLEGHITALCFSPDGSLLYVGVSRAGMSGVLQIWSFPDFELQLSRACHTDSILSIAASRDGSYVATAGGDRALVFWETDTWHEHSRIEAHDTQIMAVSFSPDCKRIVTSGTDHQLRVWEWAKGDPLFFLGRHKRGLFATHWADDGQSIVAADEKGTVYRYTNIESHSGAAGARAATEKRVTSVSDTVQSLTINAKADHIYLGTQSGTIRIVQSDGKSINTVAP